MGLVRGIHDHLNQLVDQEQQVERNCNPVNRLVSFQEHEVKRDEQDVHHVHQKQNHVRDLHSPPLLRDYLFPVGQNEVFRIRISEPINEHDRIISPDIVIILKRGGEHLNFRLG